LSSVPSRAVTKRTGVASLPGPHASTHLEAVEVRHHHVEHDEVGLDLAENVERLSAVGGQRHVEPMMTKGGSRHRPEVLLVVDNKQALPGHEVWLR
jgi:hypothetical protein